MFIVGTYPELIGAPDGAGNIVTLRGLVDSIIPSEACVHLLPPYPSSGDGGFAPNDWFSVRDDLGTWDDLAGWASVRKLVVDGVYNHVGLAHPFAVEFFRSPREDGPLYAYHQNTTPSAQLSPRGGSVFHQYTIHESLWQVWQTFSRSSMDIRLSHPQVIAEIDRHLDHLAKSRIFGVRLDGCAYYGHDIGIEQFHNPAGRVLSQSIARRALEKGLFVLAQLDADPAGASYFLKREGWSVPVVDYAYSAVLTRAILRESAAALVLHIERTKELPCAVIRPPRTHDGILLQSDLLTADEVQDLEELSRRWSLPMRTADGDNYELNSSLPFICSLGVDEAGTWRRILLIVALTSFLSGTPYFYLPFLVGDIPESRTPRHSDEDPRALNRCRLEFDALRRFSSSSVAGSLRTLLTVMEAVRLGSRENISASTLSSNSEETALILSRDNSRYVLACNLGTKHGVDFRHADNLRLVWQEGVSDSMIEPLGVGIWRNRGC